MTKIISVLFVLSLVPLSAMARNNDFQTDKRDVQLILKELRQMKASCAEKKANERRRMEVNERTSPRRDREGWF